MRSTSLLPPSPPMAVALAALLIASGGTAVAATNLVAGDQLIKRASLSGNRLRKHTITATQMNLRQLGKVPSASTADAATSASHATTADAAVNATNATNAAVASSPGLLSSGKMLTGAFAVTGVATSGGQRAETDISFAFPFASAPTASVIVPGGAQTAQCPGSFTNPQAAAGNLCLYEANEVNVTTDCVYTGVSNCGFATKYGGIEFILSAATGTFRADGTWAATAP